MPQKEKIQEMFDSVAPSYDRLNHIMSLGVDRLWRKRAIREIVDGSQQRILDVACGTGDSTIAIALAAGNSGTRVTGVDISEGMMSLVMRKAAHEGVHDRIKLMKADAEALPFPDGSFHRVFCAFGIRNFEHKDIALQEFHRVIAPGGKVVILELSVPDKPFLRRLYDLYFMHILPMIGGLISGNKQAYRYLPASVHAFPPPAAFCNMIRTAGFTDVRFRTLTLGLCRLYLASR
ncbi:MAG: bifunctional demethylmenaquinone methyltransferase/2-methoxy-6-polyprenyl-1,4-benzoquinol methylase UbiE [Bacteroidales bacterium]|nr:bifunctional demethylmenaquinone methyltransferase/2-methoxy-6-polyprenyl-1,4-benzoquinol methylase UbiE [Bacteroidales bacterium]